MADRIKTGFGDLNRIERQNVGRALDPRNTKFSDIVRQQQLDTFKQETFINSGPLKGIILRVDRNVSNEPNSWISAVFQGETPPNLLSVKVRIPEIHTALPEPANYGPNAGTSHKIIDMYPSFLAINEEVSNKPVSPGDIVYVDYGNRDNLSDPIYIGPVFNSSHPGAVGKNSAVNSENENQNNFLAEPPGNSSDLPRALLGGNGISNTNGLSGSPDDLKPLSSINLPPMKNREIAYQNGISLGEIELIEVPVPLASKPGVFVAKRQYDAFAKMVQAGKREGIYIILNSGFRSMAQQEYLYDGYVKRKPGFNLAARPGFSNHQTGIAFDIANTQSGQGQVYVWLANNAHKYGFYNEGRFFKGQKESWHFSYLGVEHPIIISESRISLQEKQASLA